MGLFHCYACEVGVHYTDKCPETFLKKEEMNDRFNEGIEKGIELGILKERARALKIVYLQLDKETADQIGYLINDYNVL